MAIVGKVELASLLAQRTKLTSAQASSAIAALIECIAETLHEGETVRLTGIGTFRVIETKERPGVNPRTKEPMTIPAGRRVVFSASSRLRGSAMTGSAMTDGAINRTDAT